MTSITTAFHEGGIFMYFILAFGVFTISFIVERATVLFYKTKMAPKTIRHQLLECIRRGDLKGGQVIAEALSPSNGLGRVLATGFVMRSAAVGDEELQSRMDEKLSSEISRIDRRTGFLGMFGNVATLLGLLGTIGGMINSFSAVASANPADRATLLSKGISEAMNCTAFGLIVAIPALVAYAIFQNRTDRVLTQMTEVTTEIFHDLLYLTESAGPSGLDKISPKETAMFTRTQPAMV